MPKVKLPLWFVAFLLSCASQKATTNNRISRLSFLGEFDLPNRRQFNDTTVGGLSGIDYVPAEDVYYLICDDRSDIAPARFYTAKMVLGSKGIDTVYLVKQTTLRQKSGEPFPNKAKDPLHVPDPEAMRFNRATKTLAWSSEGERIVRSDKVILSDPSINIIDGGGQIIDTLALPPNLHMSVSEKGPRQNGVFEGLAFTEDFKTLYASVEEPLYDDGSRAGWPDLAGWIRFVRYDMATKQPVAQYGYRIDAVVRQPGSKGAFAMNGVSDILALNDHQLVVTERSFSTGQLTCNVRVYLAELKGADNIAGVPALHESSAFKPVTKKLLLNMDTLNRWIDNVEGATFGPRLPNGKRSLIFVTDDNFHPVERTQFLLFQVD